MTMCPLCLRKGTQTPDAQPLRLHGAHIQKRFVSGCKSMQCPRHLEAACCLLSLGSEYAVDIPAKLQRADRVQSASGPFQLCFHCIP